MSLRRLSPRVWTVVVLLVVGALRLPGVDVQATAAHIDALVDADLARSHLTANPPVSDLTFLRRIYLDVQGRIPTYDEINHFLADHAPDCRHRLIEGLLGSEGYVDAQFIFWADLLRIQTALMGRYPGEPYIDWIKQAIRSDMPYDQLVSALITATGPALSEGNGATGYYLRDAGMPQDNMSNTVQVFLGTRLACAQCHNHPFDRWTRVQYLQMAAYTSSTRAETDPALVNALKSLSASQPGGPSKDQKEALKRYGDAIGERVVDAAKDVIALPKDYQYPDGKPGSQVHAHPIFGVIPVAKGQTPRQAYAAWLTSPENPRFTQVIANRLWKRVMGLGLIEPVDNLTDQTVASNPDLMTYLTAVMGDCGYDLKRFQEILYHTRAYQRQVTTTAIPDPGQYHFQGPVERRLGAEAIWDSLVTLVIQDPDERRLTDVSGIYAFYRRMVAKTPQEIWDQIVHLADTLAQRRALSDRWRELEEQSTTDKETLHKTPEFQRMRLEAQSLDNAIKDLSFDHAHAAQPPEEDPRWKGMRRDLVRASELPSPAPPGHFLRDFGQSDRMLIDNANHTAAVTQALTLLNGFVDQTVLQPKTMLMRTIDSVHDRDDKVRLLFLTILTREPTTADLAAFSHWTRPLVAAAGANPKQVEQAENRHTDALVRAVAWTLINSHEFIFSP